MAGVMFVSMVAVDDVREIFGDVCVDPEVDPEFGVNDPDPVSDNPNNVRP